MRNMTRQAYYVGIRAWIWHLHISKGLDKSIFLHTTVPVHGGDMNSGKLAYVYLSILT